MGILNFLKKNKTKTTEKKSATKKDVVEKKKKIKKTTKIVEKKEKVKKVVRKKKDRPKKKIKKSVEDLSHVIIRPNVTEKSAILSGDRQYTFIVSQDANKVQIRKAIEQIYNISPISVNIINNRSMKTTKRGRTIHVPAEKKAIITLRKDDSIEFV